MDTVNWLLIIALLIGIICVILWKQKREISDGKAAWWAALCEPKAYIMEDIEDYGVTERAANARAKLALHGNTLIHPENDIWVYVYRADPMTPTMDFELWYDTKLQEVQRRREQWRKQKAEWNSNAAKQAFGGQATYTATSAN